MLAARLNAAGPVRLSALQCDPYIQQGHCTCRTSIQCQRKGDDVAFVKLTRPSPSNRAFMEFPHSKTQFDSIHHRRCACDGLLRLLQQATRPRRRVMFHNRRSTNNNRSNLSNSINSRSRGGRRGGYSGRKDTGQSEKPRGLFRDRIWHCDCEPRLPAEHFRVKKEGPNKGRWFYTCQKAQNERCGFFLWDEDAEPRMQDALLNHGGTEVHAADGTKQDGAAPPAVDTASNSRKRPAPMKQDQDDESTDDEALPWPSTADDPPAAAQLPSTPRKAVKTSADATAGSHIRQANGLNTPQTSTTNARFAAQSQQAAAQGQQTPTPARFIDAETPITPSKAGEDITSTVLSYIGSCHVNLNNDQTAGIRAILETHNHQVRGFIKGRDVAREAVKMKDARISELTGRIEALESDLELYRARVRGLKDENQRLSLSQETPQENAEL